MKKIESFNIGRRKLGNYHNWENLDIKNYKIDKPTIICLGGNCTRTSYEANSLCKVAEHFIGLKPQNDKNEFATYKDVDVVGIGYGVEYDEVKKCESDTATLSEQEISEISNNLIKSLCFDDDNKLLNNVQIIKNFNKITFFTHCFGSVECNELCRDCYYKMLNMGIKKATINKAFDQMFCVSYTPYQAVKIPNLQVISMQDKVLRNGAIDATISSAFLMDNSFFNKYKHLAGNVIFKESKRSLCLISSNLQNAKNKENLEYFKNAYKVYEDEHDIATIYRDIHWRANNLNISEYGEEVSKTVGYVLANCVANSIENNYSSSLISKPTLEEILNESREILGKTQNGEFYKEIREYKLLYNESVDDIPEYLTKLEIVKPSSEDMFKSLLCKSYSPEAMEKNLDN